MNEGARILVVDDEPQLTRVLRTGLKSRGYDVRVAADGLSIGFWMKCGDVSVQVVPVLKPSTDYADQSV